MPTVHMIRSIKTRIFAGFAVILTILIFISGMVWRAGQDLNRALSRDTASLVTASRINNVQADLWEARLRLSEYLRSKDVVTRHSLEKAIDRLQTAADAPGQDAAFRLVSEAIPAVRNALADVADAISARQSAAATLVAATAALFNSGTALAGSAVRTQDAGLAQAAVELMANVALANTIAGRAADLEDNTLFASAATAAGRAEALLEQFTASPAGSERIDRLTRIVKTDVDELQASLRLVQKTIIARNDRLVTLDSAVARATTEASITSLTGTAEQRARRLGIQAAQSAVQVTVIWGAVGAFVLGLIIALGLSLSITRRLDRLAGAVRGFADGALDAAVPGIGSHDELGAMAGAISLFKEKALEQQTLQNIRFEAALDNMRQGLFMLGSNNRVSVLNRRFADMFGISDRLPPGDVTLDEIITTAIDGKTVTPQLAEALFRLPEATGREAPSTYELPDGRSITSSYQKVEGGGWVATYEDITARRQAEVQLDHMALHDALTNLPNRTLFQIHLERELSRSSRGEQIAVILLDLDRFKTVNDTLGHQVGDVLLQAVAGRLMENLRENDLVARLGGDEFAIIQSRVEQPRNARALAQRLVEIISLPYEIDEHQIAIGLSLGIALVPTDGTAANEILKNADLALYRAKGEGRGTYRFFEPMMDSEMRERRQLELDLRNAVMNHELEVFYQPLVDMTTGKVSCCEALLRWRHPTRGFVLPGDFVPLAEEVGLIVPIGEWVIDQACHAAVGWPGEIRLALNISVAQFRSPHLTEAISQAVQVAGLDPNRLDIEITESVLMQDTQATLAKLEALRALGIRISMDDFGTGYSSLSYLRKFPFDKIKIDQSFVRDVDTNDGSKAIVRAITQLGRALGIAVVAEGIETTEQLAGIKAEGCAEGQGFLFSRPCPAEAVRETIVRINRLNPPAKAGGKLAA